jgi:hypothetical protein
MSNLLKNVPLLSSINMSPRVLRRAWRGAGQSPQPLTRKLRHPAAAPGGIVSRGEITLTVN